jgi:hypothetical protein
VTRVADALELAGKGWPIFPGELTDDVPPKKVPIGSLVHHGFHDATVDLEQIARFWEIRPDAYIAVAMPPDSVALDVDNAAAFERIGLKLPDGPGQGTPRGGYHRFFKTDGRVIKQSVKTQFAGADTRVGGFGVALVTSQGSIDQAWQAIRALPLVLQIIVWILFLPVIFGLWVWETTWPLIVRLVLVVGVAGWNLLVFLPSAAQAKP